MLKRTRFTVITLAVAVVCSVGLHAQTLQTGTWTGIAVGPDGTSNYVTFEVKGSLDVRYVWSPDGRSVRPDGGIIYHSREGSIQLEDIELDTDTLTYDFAIDGGLHVTCSLTRQEDGSYTGACSAGGTPMGRHTMHPPTD